MNEAPSSAVQRSVDHEVEASFAPDVIREAVAPDPHPRDRRLRPIAVMMHRYVGLAMTVFLVVAGLTGSVLAFYHELDAALSPELHHAPPPYEGARMLELEGLHGAAERQLPTGLRVSHLPLTARPGHSVRIFAAAADGGLLQGDDEFFFDPYTGKLLGSRKRGDLGQGTKNLMPFLYKLHYSLALGEVGSYLFGIVALLWTLDCFVGAYLTFPSRRKRDVARSGKSWLARWKPAWLVRASKLFSFVFTWHRASGLWVWAMLLVFAWSAVGLNLHEVYKPMMTATFGMADEPWSTLPKLSVPRREPRLSFEEARVVARSVMGQQAAIRGYEVLDERAIGYSAETGNYEYRVRSSLDISDRYPATTVWLDGNTGQYVAFYAPTGQATGNTITSWLYHLHFGSIAIGGWPYRIFVSLMGLTVATLSITGVWIWWRKRSKRSERQ